MKAIAVLVGMLLYSGVMPCGVPDIQPLTDYRIVGGISARPHSWPWQVLLLNYYKELACGASILDDRWILTAAHCYTEPKRQGELPPYYVRVGEHDVSRYVVEPYQKDIVIAKHFLHPKNNLKTNDHDMALIKLAQPIKFSKHVKPICLPEIGKNPKEKSICYATGWGSTQMRKHEIGWSSWLGGLFSKRSEKRDDGARYLNQVAVPIMNTGSCRQTKYEFHEITDNMICAGTPRGYKDACQGDSGGPLVCQEGDKWVQHGVTSWGLGCGDPGYPGVYAKISKYITWINDIMAMN